MLGTMTTFGWTRALRRCALATLLGTCVTWVHAEQLQVCVASMDDANKSNRMIVIGYKCFETTCRKSDIQSQRIAIVGSTI